ncbi:hypothetical protein Pmani_014008 [Petrolisthes manimaculis]|uniref:Chitin-binding type-2 domain-containing protein n=1 Tax=Petrolisthes manimaculis TaxID=1843537 RepID=A0AAE1UBI5_9EUCA|nr:hypothetical protein Pmani_014008 [Petrolisthes manimaculis]
MELDSKPVSQGHDLAPVQEKVITTQGVLGASLADKRFPSPPLTNGNGQNGNGYSYNGASPSNGYGGSPSNGYDSPDVLRGDASVVNLVDSLTNNIPGGGVPGEDYPILASIPDTGFNCQDQEFPGYFADTADEAGCQVFHICQFDGRQDSFLCPNGTIFNQQYFVCDWWYNVDCQASEQYRSLNVDIGKVMLNQEESLRIDMVDPSALYNTPTHRQQQQQQQQQQYYN